MTLSSYLPQLLNELERLAPLNPLPSSSLLSPAETPQANSGTSLLETLQHFANADWQARAVCEQLGSSSKDPSYDPSHSLPDLSSLQATASPAESDRASLSPASDHGRHTDRPRHESMFNRRSSRRRNRDPYKARFEKRDVHKRERSRPRYGGLEHNRAAPRPQAQMSRKDYQPPDSPTFYRPPSPACSPTAAPAEKPSYEAISPPYAPSKSPETESVDVANINVLYRPPSPISLAPSFEHTTEQPADQILREQTLQKITNPLTMLQMLQQSLTDSSVERPIEPHDEDAGFPWTLDPKRLLQCIEPRLQIRDTRRMLSTIEDFANANRQFLFVDAVVLKWVPNFALTPRYVERVLRLLQEQVEYLRGQIGNKMHGPLATWRAPVFDSSSAGFVFSASNLVPGIAAVPMEFVKLNGREEIILKCSSPAALPAPAVCHRKYLDFLAILCKAMCVSDIPTLSSYACFCNNPSASVSLEADLQSCLLLSARHAGTGHPVVRVFKHHRGKLAAVLRALKKQIGSSRLHLTNFLKRFERDEHSSISETAYTQWLTAGPGQPSFLQQAWPLDLEKLEAAEVSLALAFEQTQPQKVYH
jgi:hypothetical protein